MNDNWPSLVKYYNLLKPSSEIGTDIMQALLAQREVLHLARLFGICKTLSLISITGEIVHSTPSVEKEM